MSYTRDSVIHPECTTLSRVPARACHHVYAAPAARPGATKPTRHCHHVDGGVAGQAESKKELAELTGAMFDWEGNGQEINEVVHFTL